MILELFCLFGLFILFYFHYFNLIQDLSFQASLQISDGRGNKGKKTAYSPSLYTYINDI